MKITPAIAHAYIHAGYRSPDDNPLFCKNCGACRITKVFSNRTHFCRRHQFYVHALGSCPFCSAEEYVEPPRKESPFVQDELF